MQVIHALAIVLAVVGVPGCGPAGESATNVGWDAPENYDFVLESSCGERSFIGRFHVVVHDGRVADVEGLDDPGRSMLEQGYEEDVPTLSGLLDEVERARDMGADVVDVERTANGRPQRVTIDGDMEAYDDEACYVVSDFREGKN